MRVTVRMGEPYRRQAGREVQVDLGPNATVGDLLAAIDARFPGLLQSEVPPTVLLDDRVVDAGERLNDGAAPTLVWALSGG